VSVVAAIPPRDGKDADPELVASLVGGSRGLDELPRPKDGEDGRDADTQEIMSDFFPKWSVR
jgi:hypothetical protein